MPPILTGENYQQLTNLDGKHYDYDYPDGLKLGPQDKLHKKLVGRLMDRARLSQAEMEKRYDNWQDLDKTLTAFMPVTEAEEKVRNADERKPVSIVVPVSYTILQTMLSYFTSLYMNDPLFMYEGVGPEDTIKAIMLEKVIENQTRRAKTALNLHTMWRDNIVYGMGTVGVGWDVEYGQKTVYKQKGFMSNLFGALSGESYRTTEETTRYEGNRLSNISPYRYFPDPNMNLGNLQRSEFQSYLETTNKMQLLKIEDSGSDDLFNARYLKHLSGISILRSSGESKSVSAMQDDLTTPVDVLWMYVNLIPSEWELGDSDYPEIWSFGVAADCLLIKAKPLGLNHGMFPIATCASDHDGYSLSPTSPLEIIQGLQKASDWFFNSRVANVRKSLNDVFIVDPSMVSMVDMMNPKPGGVVKLRESMWGVQGAAATAVAQMKVMDVTQGNVNDIGFMMDLTQKSSGAVDILQGVMREGGERRSALEARETKTSAVSRLEKAAKLVWAQAHQDIAYMLAHNTQQLMEESTYVGITGRWMENLQQEFPADTRIEVRPEDLAVDFDVIPHNDQQSDSQNIDTLMQAFQIAATSPAIYQNMDIQPLYLHIMRAAGAKNIADFARRPIQPVVVPDDVAAEQQQAGNIIPIGGQQ